MKTSFAVMAAALIGAAVPAYAGKTLNIEPGMWESQINLQMEGMPMSMPSHTFKKCLTADDIAKGEDELVHPESRDRNEKCDVKSHHHAGNTITVHLMCTSDEGKADIHGKIIIDSRTAYHGGFDVDATSKRGPMKMHQTFTGKRIGSCSK